MNEWSIDGFSSFFHRLWGKPPFAWQRNLAERVLTNTDAPWPEAVALPTASGKTACLDVAVFTLAARAVEKGDTWISDAPRRLFFVVDRRIIVDEAFERAQKIAQRLRHATKDDGILFAVAERLRKLAGSDIPLMCFQLRGGMYRSDAWARSPLQPAIIATTVDQIGSRLLFRAYGRSAKAWPIQAGLAGNDVLILLDEAHCSQPFMETLVSVRKYRDWAETPLPNPFHVSIMSATPPDTPDVFRDTSEEPRTQDHPLGKRQLAAKKTALKMSKASGKNARKDLAEDLAREAEALAQGTPLAVVIFANYVATARAVHELLKKKHGENAVLLTGRMRPIDKDDIISERLARFQLSSARSGERRLDAPVFVVATQTLEVGADLDFDLLVTECASLDALRQRFGRLNRMGRDIDARAVILMRTDLAKSSADDPVYGESLGRAWEWLTREAGESLEIDMGVAELAKRLPEGDALAQLNAPTTHAPVMLPAHVDCWAQTMPEPFPSPDVALFLHGPGRASADVQVCWRADVDLSSSESSEQSLDVLSLCPPSAAEALSVPIWAMRQWMKPSSSPMGEISDVEGVAGIQGDDSAKGDPKQGRSVIRWRGREESEVTNDAEDIRPGDVIVIPTSEEGWETLGDFPGGPSVVLDWGDRAHAKARGKFLLRFHPSVIAEWPESEAKHRASRVAADAQRAFDEDPEALLSLVAEVIALLAKDEAAPAWLKSIAAGLAKEKNWKRAVIPHPLGNGVIVKGREQIDPQAEEYAGEQVDWFSDEDDASASGTAHVFLESHLKGVAALARRFSAGCGLPMELVEVEETSGELHDTGKADPRFQALLRGGNRWARGELLAKSEDIPQGRNAYERARKAVGYPKGGRHELLSIRLAESSPDSLPTDPGLRDLALHLIESHHGHCRPFAPVVFDPEPVKEISLPLGEIRLSACSETKLERLDSGVPERFWRLTRRYGWWGLAWLEAIFRLADHRQSEREEKDRRNAK